MKTLTIIDTFGFFFRNYFALPHLRNKDGFPTGLLTGFINFISTIEKEHPEGYILFALDSKGKSFRNEIYSEYKANRPPAPEELLKQLPVAIEWIKKMGFQELEKDKYEADDIIASVTKVAKENGFKVQIVSHDKDLYQLIDDDKVVLYDPLKKENINEKGCKEKFGVEPKYIIDYLSLVGDSADNIPGVKGIGAKGAKKLIDEFGAIEDIYENIDKIRNERTKKLLEEGKERAFLSKKLVRLKYDLFDEEFDLQKYKIPNENVILKIKEDLLKYDIKAVLKRFEKSESAENESEQKKEFEDILLDDSKKLFAVIDSIKNDAIVAFDTETTSLNVKDAKIVGFSFAYDNKKAYYVPIAHSYLGVGEQISLDDAKKAIEKLMRYKIVGQNIKYDLAILYNNFGFERIVPYADTMILSWLLNPEVSAGLDNMAYRFFGYKMKKFKQMVKKGDNFSSVDIESAKFYAAEDAWMTYRLYQKLITLLDEVLINEAKSVEFPFINTLISMESEGIKLDCDFFEKLLKNSEKELSKLTKEIYELAGDEFNINSTKQLGAILFDKLGLRVIRKTKTGYSTDEKVLNELKNDHPIIEKILQYREYYKLQSTYIKPLLKYAYNDKNHRIYTSFLQTGTATGRLSSQNPNLQNIPTRSEMGREIRRGFVSKEGHKLVSIDYSQIELRLLAHFSQDEALIKAFEEDKDIHLETAKMIFSEDEAKEKRGIAKAVNFGLLYGMGPRKLSQTVNVSLKEAKEYIQRYFDSFPTVKEYLTSIQKRAETDGFVETLLKRRRYFDFQRANPMQKASFSREAPNTVFQGSAADLIKMAMNKIDNEFDKNQGKILLQIHDELIFEVKEEIVEEYAKKAKNIMENIYALNVPIKCSLTISENWGDLKKSS